jgi:ADP-ribose pyrophosphatase YjhB (NUDIX family)
MLVYWIPQTDPTLPANASHRVGISAFVVNKEGEALVVKEKHGRNKDWKLPTGVVDEGEDICAAAIREVKEETGIEAEFAEILSFRQSHKSFFSKSDLNFVCMLKPLSFDIQKQNSEIEEAKWMPIEKYAAQASVQESKLMDYIAKICFAKKDNDYNGFSALATATRGSGKRYLYSSYQTQEQ